jgi:hypothetical protein
MQDEHFGGQRDGNQDVTTSTGRGGERGLEAAQSHRAIRHGAADGWGESARYGRLDRIAKLLSQAQPRMIAIRPQEAVCGACKRPAA